MYPLVTPQERGRPTTSCPHCASERFKKKGFYSRAGDSRRVQRFSCKDCGKSFSRAGYSPWYRHRYRRLNPHIKTQLVSSGTIRGTARLLNIHPDTVSRHLTILGQIAKDSVEKERSTWPKAKRVQMDDLITFEHSALKQVSVTLMTDSDRYRMLGFCVSRIPTSGTIAQKAREKYGLRPDESILNRHKLLAEIKVVIADDAAFITDAHQGYPPLIQRHCPNAHHDTYLSRRACVAGQGELKEGGFDPLFCINHQMATLRAFVSRLVRRTWNTTKKLSQLEAHLWVMLAFYNAERRPLRAQRFDLADSYF